MIFEDIFKKIQNPRTQSLRYLLYLSKNNKWVHVGGDVYKITIRHIVRSVRRLQDGHYIWTTDYEPVSLSNNNDKESKLKSNLSQTAYSVSVSEGGHNENYCGDHGNLLSHLNLNLQSHFYHRLNVSNYAYDKNGRSLGDGAGVCIELVAENFDSIFAKKIDELNNSEARIAMIKHYEEQKKLAHHEAVKNPIWLAAASGDHELLEQLLEVADDLDGVPDVDLNSIFEGKSILKAMLDGNDPYKYIMYPTKPTQNYAATFDLLLKYGLDKEKVKQFYYYLTLNNDMALYPKNKKDPNSFIPLLKSFLLLEEQKNNEVHVRCVK